MTRSGHGVKTVFLDRDGVINVDSPDYIKTPEEFVFIPGSVDAIRRLTEKGFQIFVVTNQSLINRKMIPLETLDRIFDKMIDGIAAGGGCIREIFYCPHAPEERCECRKPNPGMILQASRKYGLDLSQAAMVGDSAKDIRCGRNAGVALSVLVKTGNGDKALQTLLSSDGPPDHVAANLYDAATWIIHRMTDL
jgi:histidinol-phosphate phosphatase family protein